LKALRGCRASKPRLLTFRRTDSEPRLKPEQESNSSSADERFDAIVIGGGPAGSTTARQLALAGLRVAVVEKHQHPRFHIGESLLPRNFSLIKELGLLDRTRSIPQTRKLGAEFIMGHGQDIGTPIWFSQQLGGCEPEAFNTERAPFDKMLLDAARDAGAHILENAQVKQIAKLEEDDARITLDDGRELHGRCLADASGQSTIVGRHLKTRIVLPHLKKVAYFGHFTGVDRLPGDMAGFISIVMCSEGWFWLIPLDEHRTSIGLVMDLDKSKMVDVPADQMLGWGIANCPVLRERTSRAAFPESNHVIADFSYRCEPFAGPGYFLVGDAATFMDPIFSTGVCLAMMSGVEAAQSIHEVLRDDFDAAHRRHLRKEYCKFVDGSSSVFFWLVNNYYNHSFRELFLNGTGPCNVHGAVIGILAGNVFPRPPFALRWRLKLFELCMRLNAHFPLVPRRKKFSLFDSETYSGAMQHDGRQKSSLSIEVLHAGAGKNQRVVEHGAANH
jgi:flavin-dependent dehydrogenase